MANTTEVEQFREASTSGVAGGEVDAASIDWYSLGVGHWYPEFDIPTAFLLTVTILLGGVGNVIVIFTFMKQKSLRKVPFNALVVTMAIQDLILCWVGAVMDLIQLTRGLTRFGLGWCLLKLAIKGECICASITLVAAIAVLRLTSVVRTTGGAISWRAVKVTIGISVAGGVIGFANKLDPGAFRTFMCRGVLKPVEPSAFLDLIFPCACGVTLASYPALYLLLRYRRITSTLPNPDDKREILTRRVGLLVAAFYFLCFVGPLFPWVLGARPHFTRALNYDALMKGITNLHGVASPIIYVCGTSVMRRAFRRAVYGAQSGDTVTRSTQKTAITMVQVAPTGGQQMQPTAKGAQQMQPSANGVQPIQPAAIEEL